MDLKGETAELATCILEYRDENLAEIFYDSLANVVVICDA